MREMKRTGCFYCHRIRREIAEDIKSARAASKVQITKNTVAQLNNNTNFICPTMGELQQYSCRRTNKMKKNTMKIYIKYTIINLRALRLFNKKK